MTSPAQDSDWFSFRFLLSAVSALRCFQACRSFPVLPTSPHQKSNLFRRFSDRCGRSSSSRTLFFVQRRDIRAPDPSRPGQSLKPIPLALAAERTYILLGCPGVHLYASLARSRPPRDGRARPADGGLSPRFSVGKVPVSVEPQIPRRRG